LFQNPDILFVIAEVAVTITGFTAIGAVFRRRQGKWARPEQVLFLVLMRTSLIVLFFAFVPWLVGQAVTSDDLVWRISCGLYGLMQLIDVTWYLRHKAGEPTRGQKILAPLGFVNVTSQMLVAAGMLGPGQLVYVAGLLFLMYVSIHNFVLLLIIGLDEES
jgi:hypothetical protein